MALIIELFNKSMVSPDVALRLDNLVDSMSVFFAPTEHLCLDPKCEDCLRKLCDVADLIRKKGRPQTALDLIGLCETLYYREQKKRDGAPLRDADADDPSKQVERGEELAYDGWSLEWHTSKYSYPGLAGRPLFWTDKCATFDGSIDSTEISAADEKGAARILSMVDSGCLAPMFFRKEAWQAGVFLSYEDPQLPPWKEDDLMQEIAPRLWLRASESFEEHFKVVADAFARSTSKSKSASDSGGSCKIRLVFHNPVMEMLENHLRLRVCMRLYYESHP